MELASQVAEPVPGTNPTDSAPANDETTADVRSAEQIWKAALAGLGDMTADVAGDYQRVEMTGQNAMKVTFGGDYQVQLCNRPDRRQRLESSLAVAAGRIIRLDFVAASTGNKTVGPAKLRMSRRQQIKQLEMNPLVQTTIETFNAEVVDFELPREPARNPASAPGVAN